MQAVFTKLTIGFLILSLIVGVGLTALTDTANLNNLAVGELVSNNDIYQQSQQARIVVHGADNASSASGLDAQDTDIAQTKDAFSTADELYSITTVIQTFFTDLSNLIPLPNYVLVILISILTVIGVAGIIYLALGRSP